MKQVSFLGEGFINLKELLDHRVELYNRPEFIESDPVSIPHLFTRKEDIEIAGFLTATISWGLRKNIIKSARSWMKRMNDSPHEFLLNASTKELKTASAFYYRTFTPTDASHYIKSLRNLYKNHGGLQPFFENSLHPDQKIMQGMVLCRKEFFTPKHEKRTEKHFSDPSSNSAAKRINMFLRWMVRDDKCGVDFGIWKNVGMKNLLIPLDIHSGRVGRNLGLLTRKQDDMKSVIELTENLRKLYPKDPVKYDFALFGMGVFEKF